MNFGAGPNQAGSVFVSIKIQLMNIQKNIFPPPIYVVSGGRGLAGNNMVQSLLIQYPENDIPVIIVPHVSDESQIFDVVMQAKTDGGMITHTMVNPDLRAKLNDLCKEFM
jgi:regulator of PEP synthase PpsR (kinase-PPPase family)